MSRLPAITAALVLCATAARAQQSTLGTVLVRDPAKQAIAGAHGELTLEPAHTLPALHGLSLGSSAASLAHAIGTSDAHGSLTFRHSGGADRALAGSGFVHTDRGLGALVARLRPGQAQRLQLEPMGEVTTHGGSEPFTLFARARLTTGEVLDLPPQHGTSVRLPAGVYEVWAKNRDGWTWQRLAMRSAQRTLLSFTGAACVLQTRPGTRLQPAGHPEVELLGGEHDVTLLATALQASLVAFVDGNSDGERTLPAGSGPLRWPPTPLDTAATVPGTVTTSDAVVVSLLRDNTDSWRVLAVAQAREGRFNLRAPPPGDTWLLALAADHAPLAVAWSATTPPPPLRLLPGVQLVVRARDEQGLPIVDLAVEYTPGHMEPATARGHSDGRGQAQLGAVLAPGSLRVCDERFANQQIDVDTIPLDGITLTALPGATMRGIVKWPDGTPAHGVVVTLRDPHGELRPAQRALATGDDGAFTFTGLPPQRALVLFGTVPKLGHTWSARLDRAVAGGDGAIELALRDEDPQLAPPPGR